MKRAGGGLVENALATVAKHGMLTGGETVVVSVSGGPDSIALLHFLSRISGDMGLRLAVFHLDHMMRGEESRLDAMYVEAVANELGIPVKAERLDVPGEMERYSHGPQDAARRVRLERLALYARDLDADRIAVGHTADDQVETFLMRAVQGAGITGLAAIAPVSGDVIRPLIEVWRHEVEDYLIGLGIEPRMDRSNLETSYLRNRVRHKLIPCLVSEFGDAVREVMLRNVASLAEDRSYLRAVAAEAFESIGSMRGGEARLDRERLVEMPASLTAGVLRNAWERIAPGEPMLGSRHVRDLVDKVVGGASGSRLDLPASFVAEREYGLVVLRKKEPAPREFGPAALEVPGSVATPWGQVVTAGYVLMEPGMFVTDPNVEYVRADLSVPLAVRTPAPGDRFRPLGMEHERKIKDFFIDEKTPRRLRHRTPLVLEGDRVVWVAGHRLDDRYRLRAADRRAIKLTLAEQGSPSRRRGPASRSSPGCAPPPR